MNNIKHILLLIILTGILSFTQSCKKDNDDPTPSNKLKGEYHFSEIQDREFQMWTNGEEINTSGLDMNDYIPSEDAIQLSEQFHSALKPFIFKSDSLFYFEYEEYQGVPIEISNDTIYIIYGIMGGLFREFFGIKTSDGFNSPQGFYRYKKTGMSFNVTATDFKIEYVTPESVKNYHLGEDHMFDSVYDLPEQDTLIIVNQNLIFKK